jgi:competence protein ComEC
VLRNAWARSKLSGLWGESVHGSVDPELAVISVGADNNFGHPSADTLDRLRAIPTYRTDSDGSIEVVTDGTSYGVHTQR